MASYLAVTDLVKLVPIVKHKNVQKEAIKSQACQVFPSVLA